MEKQNQNEALENNGLELLQELWVKWPDINNSAPQIGNKLSELSFLKSNNKDIDFRSDMVQILSNPNQKEVFLQALDTNKQKIQETLKPYVQNALKNISINGIYEVDVWDIFALQTYLVAFKWKSHEEIWLWEFDINKIEALKDDFNALVNDNFSKYVKWLLLSNKLTPIESDTLMKNIDHYLTYNVDINKNGKIDSSDLLIFQNYVIEAMRVNNIDTWKIDSSIWRIMEYNFDINHNINFIYNDGNRETHYTSLDSHSPRTTQEDKSQELQNVLNVYKNELDYDSFQWNKDKENTKENLKNIIQDFYVTHKEELAKHGIHDITQLTPKQASILSSMITMHSINYYHAQALTPWSEWWYLKDTTNEEKELYFKWKNDAIEIIHIIYTLKQKDWLNNISIFDYYNKLKESNPEKFNLMDKAISNVLSAWYKHTFTDEQKNYILKNNINEVDSVYKNISELYKESQKIDKISVDELLKWWKWICRNYAVANEKLFETLKNMQNSNNNQLKNSAMPTYVDYNTTSWIYNNQWELNNIWRNEAKDWTFAGHAWNLLITIDENWRVHKTQLDPTRADWWDWTRAEWQWWWQYGNVRTLDRTYERIFQDVAKENKSIEEVIKQMIKYVNSISESSIQTIITNKVVEYLYNNLDSWKLTYEQLQNIIWKNYEQNKPIREWLINITLIKEDYNLAKKLVWHYDISNLEGLTKDLAFNLILWNQAKVQYLSDNSFLANEVKNLSKEEFLKKYEKFWVWSFLIEKWLYW